MIAPGGARPVPGSLEWLVRYGGGFANMVPVVELAEGDEVLTARGWSAVVAVQRAGQTRRFITCENGTVWLAELWAPRHARRPAPVDLTAAALDALELAR